MIITDTHTHLYSEAFDDDRAEVIERALSRVYTIFYSCNRFHVHRGHVCTRKQLSRNMFLMMGVHPTHVKDNYLEELSHVKRPIEARKFVAIGEIGIDFIWDQSTLKLQQDSFRAQIQLAKQYNYPL